MKMEEVIKCRQRIEDAYNRGVLTDKSFKRMTEDLCKRAGCNKATQEICSKDGPCCDVVIRRAT